MIFDFEHWIDAILRSKRLKFLQGCMNTFKISMIFYSTIFRACDNLYGVYGKSWQWLTSAKIQSIERFFWYDE